MALDELVIAAPPSKSGKESKGRAFRALKVSSVTADALWDLGGGKDDKHDRPVYATFCASESEIRPFVANLLCGRPAVPVKGGSSYRRRGSVESGYEFMRSAGYKVAYQRCAEGSVATVFLPGLLDLDPGMVDPKGVTFVVVAGADYLDAEAARMPVAEMVDHARRLPAVREVNAPPEEAWARERWSEPLSREMIADLAPLSYLAALYLSNRSRAPIPPDGRFYLQVLLAFLKVGAASLACGAYADERKFGRNASHSHAVEGSAEGRLAPTLSFKATHEEVEAVLVAECDTYFKRVEGRRK